MKKSVCISLVSMALILLNCFTVFANPAGYARRGGNYVGHGSYYGGRGGYYGGHGWHYGGGIWLGPAWWGLYYPYYPYYPYYRYYVEPPDVAPQQQLEEYVQPPAQENEPSYWYYCKDPQGYYPYVKQCPQGWMRVVPTPPQPPADNK